MNKGGVGLTGGGSGPTAAAAAAAAQKQKTLLQRVDTDITNIVDNFNHLVNVARVSFYRVNHHLEAILSLTMWNCKFQNSVSDPPVRNSQEAFMMEMRGARMARKKLDEVKINICAYVVKKSSPGLYVLVDSSMFYVQAADSLLKLVSELKQTAIFSGLASLNEHVEQKTVEFDQQAENTEGMLSRIGEEAAGCLKELECHYYSSVQRIDQGEQ
ncbi:hypothetical protein C5167_045319 [Papaver somniferum]|uniref:Mediator of RNA polymerase II transcription subunit 22 n=1 Tax=Papaver somniferum TaxID=3469 RepID=A0A4Y7LAM1_PAPSO|nr:hypothetical protein C5167_045319 [Papaver somniferum]